MRAIQNYLLGHACPMGHHFTSFAMGFTTVMGVFVLWPPQDCPLIHNANLQDCITEHHFEDESIFLGRIHISSGNQIHTL